MVAISEVNNVNVWSQTASWKSTLWSEQLLTGTLGGISGVSEPPSVLDTFDGIEDAMSVSVALKAELKVDVVTVGHHSHSKVVAEFLRDICQQVSHFVESGCTNTSRSINNEQNVPDCAGAGLAMSPLMDGIHTLVHVEEFYWSSCIQNLLLRRSVESDFLFFLQRTFPCRMIIRVGMKNTCLRSILCCATLERDALGDFSIDAEGQDIRTYMSVIFTSKNHFSLPFYVTHHLLSHSSIL